MGVVVEKCTAVLISQNAIEWLVVPVSLQLGGPG